MRRRLFATFAFAALAGLLGPLLLAPGRDGEAGEGRVAGPANRLAAESSPYLQLHAYNPVDWYPWGEEALARARRENKPIFLSIGYSTCYWCHVMEREVFSDPKIAERMNELFINIKVDREERPDLDEIYITATQLLNGSAGWPTSVFLTPDLEPFFAGTYFPAEDGRGRPGFPRLVEALSTAWKERRGEVEEHAARVVEALADVTAAAAGGASPGETPARELPGAEALNAVAGRIASRFDEVHGGFGGAPKFPSPGNLLFLWERAEAGDSEARRMVVETLSKMGRGAIYDHLDGGFHRYTLDAEWRIPHFEKMLYDNALLGELLARVAAETSSAELERLARGTFDFVLAELTLPQGAFKSAIDAETDAVEGAYYIWTREELSEVLGSQGMALLGPIYGFDGEPNFEGESYTLHLTASLEEHAERREQTPERLMSELEPHLDKLRRRRRLREFPLVDDKVLADWNGMMIAAFARGGRDLGEPRYIAAAERAAGFVLDEMSTGDRLLLHTWRGGEGKIPAFLDDYAFLLRGLLALDEVGESKRWLRAAETLAEELEERLADPLGGYFFAPKEPDLLLQTKSLTDGATPSGNPIAYLALLALAERTGKPVYRERADRALLGAASGFERAGPTQPTLARAFARRAEISPAPVLVVHADGSGPGTSGISYRALELVSGRASTSGAPLDDGWRRFRLTLEIEDGWHIHANPASDRYLVSTEILGDVREIGYPEGEMMSFDFSPDPVAVYSATTALSGELDPSSMKTISVRYQACDDRRCLPPVTQEFPLMVSAPRP